MAAVGVEDRDVGRVLEWLRRGEGGDAHGFRLREKRVEVFHREAELQKVVAARRRRVEIFVGLNREVERAEGAGVVRVAAVVLFAHERNAEQVAIERGCLAGVLSQ